MLPSFDEMKEALSLQSKSAYTASSLRSRRRGFIRRLPHRARAIEIIKLPDAMTERGGQRRSGLSLIEGSARMAQSRALRPPAGYADPPQAGYP